MQLIDAAPLPGTLLATSFRNLGRQCVKHGTAFNRGHEMVIPFILLLGAVTVAVVARKRRGTTEHNSLHL
jgi:hypothetical protein